MDEDELRGLMLAAEVPPSGADVRAAMVTGRRRNRGPVLLAAGAGVLALVGGFVAAGPMRGGPPGGAAGPAPGPVSPPGACVPALLEAPSGATGVVAAVDGTTAGGRLDGSPPAAALWRDGRPAALPAGATGRIVDVAGDTVVGFAGDREDAATGWVWRDGEVTTLAGAGGHRWTRPSAVNAAGTVAGWVRGTAGGGTVPVTWTAGGQVRFLPLPELVGREGFRSATARDIGDDGTVVGEVRGVPVVWEPGRAPLTLPMPNGATSGVAWAVAGRYAYGGAGGFEVRWDLATGAMTTLPDAGDLGARAGTADGTALLAGDGLGKPALRIRPGGAVDRLLGPGGEMATALAISADGATIGGAVVEGGQGRPAIWRCR